MTFRNKTSTLLKIIAAAYFGRPAPVFLSYALTHRCDWRCSYCEIPLTPLKEMSLEDLEKIIAQFFNLGLRYISLTGGEPLLHPEFERVVKIIDRYRIHPGCNTNGLHVFEHLESLKKMRSVTVSLDGPENIHETIRGEGTFLPAKEAVALLKKENIPVRIATVLAGHNVEHVDEIIGLGKELDVPLVLQPAWHSFLGSRKTNDDLPPGELMQKAMLRVIELKNQGAKIVNSNAGLRTYLHWPEGKYIGCLAGKLTFRMEPDGTLTHCERMDGDIPWIDLKKTPLIQALKKLHCAGCNACWCAGQVELQLARNLSPGPLLKLLTNFSSSLFD